MFALLAHLKMQGMKAFHSSLLSGRWLVPHSLPLFSGLVRAALLPAPCVQLCFESDHPYANSTSQYTLVQVLGAKRLVISFDPQTLTESNCDYVCFFT
ncbi:hypothetical protein B484DRAFT_409852, partial [Ochromonadaceae sp. CCMP2298]